MMAERGLSIDHTTIYRWVQHDAPTLERKGQIQGTIKENISSQVRFVSAAFGLAA